MVKAGNCRCGESRLAHSEGVDGSAEDRAATAAADKAQRTVALYLQIVLFRVLVVDKDNIEQVNIELVEHCIELRIDAADMRVRIDWLERREGAQLLR